MQLQDSMAEDMEYEYEDDDQYQQIDDN